MLIHQKHMDGVRAVHRRLAYERVLNKIASMHDWERKAWAGKDGFEFADNEREQLAHLLELRDIIRAELVEHGQLEVGSSNG
jgi:hypothetical protein